MPNHDLLTDDYVAGLLAKEAEGCSLKYSTMGMESRKEYAAPHTAGRPQLRANHATPRPANLPKPNTRFLRNIIKNTESHNRALLAKEEAHSKAKLEELEKAGEARRLKTNPNANDIRRRQMGDIHAILGGTKRSADKGASRSSQSRGKQEPQPRRDRKRAIWENDLKGSRDDGHRRGRTGERGPSKQEKRHSRRDASRSGEDDHPRQGRPTRSGLRSPRRDKRSRSPTRERKNYRQRSRHRSPSKSQLTADASAGDDGASDSDPLNDLIGPAPPPRHRGRGTVGGAANLDRRFSASYDPRTDTQDHDMERGDWDDAVESYRNFQKLRLSQPRPARPAGFTEDQTRGAEDGRDRSDKDVVWSKAGERRAWDQGKDLD